MTSLPRVLLQLRSSRSTSSDGQLGDSADAGNFTAPQVPVEIPKVLLEFSQRLALSQVVRELLEVAEPHLAVLPVDVSSLAHDTILQLNAMPEG